MLFNIVAAASLVFGILLVNAASTPRIAQFGTILAACGVLMLALVVIRQLAV